MNNISILADREIILLTVFVAEFIALILSNVFMWISIRENEIKRLWLLVVANIAVGIGMGHSLMLHTLIVDDFGTSINSTNFINFELVAFFVGFIISFISFALIIYMFIKAKMRMKNKYKYKMKF